MLHGTAPCFPPVFLLCPAPHSCSCLLGELCFPPQWIVCCSPCGWSGWAQSTAGTEGIKAWSPASKPGRHPPGCLPLTQPACSPELCSQLPGSLFQLSTGLRSAIKNLIHRKKGGRLASRGLAGEEVWPWARPGGHGDSFQSGACSAAPEGMEQLASLPQSGRFLPRWTLKWAGWGREVRQTVKLEVSALTGNIPLNDSVVCLFLLWTPLMSLLHMMFTAHCDQQQCAGASRVEAQCQCGRKVETARTLRPVLALPSQQGHRVS